MNRVRAGQDMFRTALAALLAALILCAPALWNGQPFLYPDTPTYLRGAEMGASKVLGPAAKPWQTQPPAASASMASDPASGAASAAPRSITSVEDKVVLAGRSVYYGALLYAGHLAGSLWLAVAVQALCVVYLLHLLMVRLWGLRERHMVGACAALALVTPLGVYTGLLMPDIFAGLGILAAGTLAVYWDRLSRPHRVVLGLLLLFALCGHASHVAVIGTMLLIAVAARLLFGRWRQLPLGALAVVAACLAGAVAAEWVFGKAVERTVGAPPLRLPHPMARLVDMGPGTDFLKRNCPQAGYVACRFLDNFPTPWDEFLFSSDPGRGAFALADPAAKRQMSQEQLRFTLDVLRHDPAGVVAGVAKDVFRQFAGFRVDVYGYSPRALTMFQGRVPDDVFARMQASRGANNTAYNEGFTLATYISTAVAIAMLFWWARRRPSGTLPGAEELRLREFAWVALAGVVTNAVVCAVLASSLDRFQARVIWIVPFLALSAAALAYSRRPAADVAAAPPPRPAQGAAS
jgi:hypothetical protein